MLTIILFSLCVVTLIATSLYPAYRKAKTGKSVKSTLIFNVCAFFGIVGLTFFIPFSAAAAEATTTTATAASGLSTAMGYIAAALSIGLSCLGAGIAVASAAPAAIGAFSEDPKAFGKALAFVGIAESISLFGLLIAILILGKI